DFLSLYALSYFVWHGTPLHRWQSGAGQASGGVTDATAGQPAPRSNQSSTNAELALLEARLTHPRDLGLKKIASPGDRMSAIGRGSPRQRARFVQMLWGERRGHGTFGAVQRLPMELPPCRNNIVILTRAGPSPPSSRIARSSP